MSRSNRTVLRYVDTHQDPVRILHERIGHVLHALLVVMRHVYRGHLFSHS